MYLINLYLGRAVCRVIAIGVQRIAPFAITAIRNHFVIQEDKEFSKEEFK